jgi:uncharacterized protein YjbI with pentapeptide repeats
MADQNEEICNTIRRAMLTTIVFSIFCLVTIARPDLAMFITTEDIKVPFLDTNVAYVIFLYVAPVILIGLTLYLHIFLERHYEQRISEIEPCLPYLFNFHGPLSKAITWFIFYGLPPLIIVLFYIKAKPLPLSSLLLFLAFGTTVTLLFIAHHRKDIGKRKESGNLPYAVTVALFKKLLIPFLIVGVIILVKNIDRKIEFHNVKLYNLKLSKYNLPNVKFTCNSELNCSQAIVRCKFDRADLKGAVFEDVTLKKTEFNFAKLQNAAFKNVTFEEVSFNSAELQGARFRGKFVTDEIDLKKVSFNDAILSGASLPYVDLTSVALRDATLEKTELYKAKLHRTILNKIEGRLINLKEADMEGAQLKGANLSYGDLVLANLTDANLEGANLEGANLEGANLEGANLEGANLEGANLKGANLKDADLKGATLSGAKFFSANLTNVKLTEVFLRGLDLRGTKGLNCKGLKRAKGWAFSYRDPQLKCGERIMTKGM